MTLAVRLLLAFGLFAIFATAVVGVPLREVTRQSIEQDFAQRLEAAHAGVRRTLAREVAMLRSSFPVCDEDMAIDRALVALERVHGDIERLDPDERIRLRHYGEAEAKNRQLDELYLFAQDGMILGSHDLARVGTRDAALGAITRSKPSGAIRYVPKPEPSLEIACVAEVHGIFIGLLARRKLPPVLPVVGAAHGVALRIADSSTPAGGSNDDAVVSTLDISEVPGLRVVATVSRGELKAALRDLDRTIVIWGSLALVAALAIGWVIARSLSSPIVELARETREVVSGQPHVVRGRGGSEMVELAEAFNRTIEELTSMRKRLAATERIAARREVARQIAHEIKNPLAPIRAAVETLRRLRAREDPAFDDYFEEATSTVLTEVHRIANIVTEFTKFARLPPPNLAPTDLVAVARGVVTLHNSPGLESSKRAKVELAVEDEPVPEILADKDQLVQVLTNLVQNALDAATAVRDDARVMVTIGRLPKQRVRIVVRDNGPGVSEDMVPRLFEPYATTKVTGTGLGLAIVQRIVFEHGGEIAYRAATKGGAVFELWLPLGGPTLLEKPPVSVEATDAQHRTPSARERSP